MNKVRFALNTFAVLSLLFACASLAQAQANRTWVSSTGSDANTATNCGRAAPCATFNAALTVTNPQGEIDAADDGTFASGGGLSITKAVTISGTGHNASITGCTGCTPVAVTLPSASDVVVFRDITINGLHPGNTPAATTSGIVFNGSGTLVVDRCKIENFSGNGILFIPTGASGPTAGDLFITDSYLQNNDGSGLTMGSGSGILARGAVDNVRFINNGLYGNGVGMFVNGRAQINISSSIFNNNGLSGILVQPTAGNAEVNMESCYVAGNNTGITSGTAGGTANVRISNVNVLDNTGSGLTIQGGQSITSFGNNRIAGNGAGNGPPSATLPQQ
jgi:hypothetical protein